MPNRTYHLIPHTHWDREWYLTRAELLCRLVPALDDLVVRLEREPGFRAFLLDGQTVLLDDYLAVRTEMAPRVRALVADGRLQLGPWYVLADELIPSGESLLRNLLAGRADAEAFGGRLDVLYSPDAFGHPAIWPALAGEFGIRYGVLWRGLGGELGQDGDLFRWRAPNGHEVLLHHLSPGGYEVGFALPAEPKALQAAWSKLTGQLVPRARTSHLAVLVGADHHAVHPAVGRLPELLADLEPDSGVRVSRLDEYFAAASAEVDPKTLPLLQGELRWSYGYTWSLQGVHGTRGPLKRRHAEAELRLERMAEPLAALALRHRRHDARPLLDHAWRTLLRSQFHDSIAGCSADPVAARALVRVDDAAAMADELTRSALDRLTGNDPDRARDYPSKTKPQLLLYNPAPRERRAVVVADLTWFRRDVLVGPPGGRSPRRAASPSDGEIAAALGGIPFQVLSRRAGSERLDAPRHYPDQDEVEVVRVAVATPRLDGFGVMPARATRLEEPPVIVESRRLTNGIIEVTVSPAGLIELHDLRTGQRYGRVLSLESEGDAGDTYSFAPASDGPPSRATWSNLRTLVSGPLAGALEARASLRSGRVRARLILALYAGSPLLRCTVELENAAPDHRLRLRLPTGSSGSHALAGGPFGPVKRQPRTADAARYPRETPVSTAPAHRYVAVGSAERGIAVLAPGFFEYEHDVAGDIAVTLLRCVGQLSREDLPTRPGNAGWPTPTPGAQCVGWERLQFALAPVGSGSIEQLWEDAFLPPKAIWLRQATELSFPATALRLEGEGLVFSSLKPAAESDGIVFRCYNATDRSVSGRITFATPFSSAARVRADEREPSRMPLTTNGTSIAFTASPREIVTLLLSP